MTKESAGLERGQRVFLALILPLGGLMGLPVLAWSEALPLGPRVASVLRVAALSIGGVAGALLIPGVLRCARHYRRVRRVVAALAGMASAFAVLGALAFLGVASDALSRIPVGAPATTGVMALIEEAATMCLPFGAAAVVAFIVLRKPKVKPGSDELQNDRMQLTGSVPAGNRGPRS